MEYLTIHSKDTKLLYKFYQDVLKLGIPDDRKWNLHRLKTVKDNYLIIAPHLVGFHSHDGGYPVYDLSESYYKETLEIVANNFNLKIKDMRISIIANNKQDLINFEKVLLTNGIEDDIHWNINKRLEERFIYLYVSIYEHRLRFGYYPDTYNSDKTLSLDTQKEEIYKTLNLKKDTMTYQVEESFIKEAYGAACTEWKGKIEAKFPELFPKKTYKVGDRFVTNGNEYILSMLSQDSVILIRLKDGIRYTDAKYVSDINKITKEELTEIMLRHFDMFKQL